MALGRPPIPIDADQVLELAGIGCTNTEIAAFFKCSPDTVVRNFAEELEKGRSELKMSLRRKQIEVAKNGNVVMLIWLGKQTLGQIDRQQLDLAKVPDDVLVEEAKKRLASESKDT